MNNDLTMSRNFAEAAASQKVVALVVVGNLLEVVAAFARHNRRSGFDAVASRSVCAIGCFRFSSRDLASDQTLGLVLALQGM